MYRLHKFMGHLLGITWKVSIFLLIIMAFYFGFTTIMKQNEKPIEVRVIVTDKFEEQSGFILFNRNIKQDGLDKKIRVEFLDKNDITNNIFTLTTYDYEKLEVGKAYRAKFKGDKLGFIDSKPLTDKELSQTSTK